MPNGMGRRLGAIEVVLPLVLLAATSVYLAAAFRISTAFSTGMVDAGFVPKLIAGLMYLSLLVVLRDALRRPYGNHTPADRAPADRDDAGGGLAGPAKVVVLTAVYVAVFDTVGYLLATPPYVFLLFLVFGFEERSQLKRIVYAVAITAVFYGLFAEVFGIRLPTAGGVP